MKKLAAAAFIIASMTGATKAQSFLDKIDRLADKVDRASNTADRASYTADRAGRTGGRIVGILSKKKNRNAEVAPAEQPAAPAEQPVLDEKKQPQRRAGKK